MSFYQPLNAVTSPNGWQCYLGKKILTCCQIRKFKFFSAKYGRLICFSAKYIILPTLIGLLAICARASPRVRYLRHILFEFLFYLYEQICPVRASLRVTYDIFYSISFFKLQTNLSLLPSLYG